jgi:hypothetical protein
MMSDMKAEPITPLNSCLITILLIAFLTGCGNGIGDTSDIASRVSYTVPLEGETNVATNSQFVAFLNEPFNSTDEYSFTVKETDGDGLPIPGTLTFDSESNSIRFSLSNGYLETGTYYTATLTTTVNEVVSVNEWNFTSGSGPDTTPPTLTNEVIGPTTPANNQEDVSVNRGVSALFSEALDPISLNSDSFVVKTLDNEIAAGVVTYANRMVTFVPTGYFKENTRYKATLQTTIKDLAGNSLATAVNWSFTTGIIIAKGPAPVALRTAEDFTILAKAGITNTGNHATQITGNIGASPISPTFMNDVYCDEMIGTDSLIYGVNIFYSGGTGGTECSRGNAFAKTKVDVAILDLGVAYTDAAGRASPEYSEFGAGILGGQILLPGLYKWGTNVVINDDITLHGSRKDVWIFQISGNMALSGKTSVLLTGGALAKNVFWQLTENVALGENAHLVGVILAKTHIALWPSASVDGRIFSQTQVTLQDNIITPPSQ